ncbi:MAG: 50S ribosomal protein L29 [Planctomycetota bacterium]|nr:50S ribosomal protein L29 [Planctomycetota bacterium]
MKAKEVRGKEDGEIQFELEKLEQELFGMKFRTLTEGIADPAKIRRSRRDLARMRTILRERELGVRGQKSRG